MMEWVIAALVGIGGFLAVWFSGRKSGKTAVTAKINEDRLEAVKEANEVRNEVEALDRDSLKSRARNWVRGAQR